MQTHISSKKYIIVTLIAWVLDGGKMRAEVQTTPRSWTAVLTYAKLK